MQELRQFTKKELNKIHRGVLKSRADLDALIESFDTSNANDPTWQAFANKNCRFCNGRGVVTLSFPGRAERLVPCYCSIRRRAKAMLETKAKPAWAVTRNGVREEVFVKE